MEIKVKFLSEVYNGELQKIDGEKSDWIDLRAAHDMFIPVGEFRYISLGLCMELPKGYEAYIVPRSSTFKKWGIVQTNSQGVIDNSYCGDHDEWAMPVYCLQGRTVYNGMEGTFIRKGDRICQFRIQKKQPDIDFVSVENLGNADRGGFGSTGTK